MAKAMLPGHGRARMVWIEFPGMKIEHDGLSLVAVHVLDTALDPGGGHQSKVAATPYRQIYAQQPYCPYRKLEQFAMPIAPDLVGKTGCLRLTVAVVVNGIDTGVV